MSRLSLLPACLADSDSSASPSSDPVPPKRLRLHHSSIALAAAQTTKDRARKACVKTRTLCNTLQGYGYRHDQIAELIGAHPRTLSYWKGGVTVPHWAVDALESAVMRVAKKVAE